MINGHLQGFERWFVDRQRARGNPNPQGLLGVEASILKTYVLFLTTET